MLVYEKNNKLNINFDNEVSENPDLQISKEDGKTEIVVDGQQQTDNRPLVVIFSGTTESGDAACDKTWEEITAANENLKAFYMIDEPGSYEKYELQLRFTQASLTGTYVNISDPSDPSTDYTVCKCFINSTTVNCHFAEA